MTLTRHDMTETAYWQTLNRKSLLRFFVFSALSEKPMHGYELADAISVCCDGVRPTDAMIYPTLKELEQSGYVECEVELQGERRRKVCSLTDKGRDAFRAAAHAWSQALPQIHAAVSLAGPVKCCDTAVDYQEVELEGLKK